MPNRPLDIAVMLDSPDENWASMDLVGEMLLERWLAAPARVAPTGISIRIPLIFRRFPWTRAARTALNADRALARYVGYPLRAFLTHRRGRFFHVVDHSYAQLVHVLTSRRTGVYCHDLDAFEPVLSPTARARPSKLAPLAWTLMKGLRAAAVVFHSTHQIGDALESQGIVPRSRLVHAPYGVAAEFTTRVAPVGDCDPLPPLPGLAGRPFLLHVGSSMQRKRLDVLFETFARLRSKHPDLRLVQQGADLSKAQRDHLQALGIQGVFIQPPRLSRAALAGLYRRATMVLVTSESEGFGFPVVEAMACGAIVVASDIPVLREVGGDAALYAPVGDPVAWAAMVDAILSGTHAVRPVEERVARAGSYSWDRHATTILEAYERIAAEAGASTCFDRAGRERDRGAPSP